MGFPKDVQTLTRVCLKPEIRIQMLILKASLYFLCIKHKFPTYLQLAKGLALLIENEKFL